MSLRHQVRRGASIFPFLLPIDNTIHLWHMQYFFQKNKVELIDLYTQMVDSWGFEPQTH